MVARGSDEAQKALLALHEADHYPFGFKVQAVASHMKHPPGVVGSFLEAARASNPSLRTSGILLGDTALRVRPSPNFKRDDRETNRVFVRIHSWYEAGVSEPGNFYGLHGDAFLKTPINVPMEDWTPTAVRQLIVSGLAGANDME